MEKLNLTPFPIEDENVITALTLNDLQLLNSEELNAYAAQAEEYGLDDQAVLIDGFIADNAWRI